MAFFREGPRLEHGADVGRFGAGGGRGTRKAAGIEPLIIRDYVLQCKMRAPAAI